MANNTSQAMAQLSLDTGFQLRLSVLLDLEAMVVLRESTGTANHAARIILAKNILYSPDSYAAVFAREIVSDTNLIGAPITNTNGALDSSADDPTIRSQIASNWNAWCTVV